MRIALVRYHDSGNVNTRLPDSLNRRQGLLPPLGIAYIAAALLKEKFEVQIIDAPASGLDAAGFKKKLLAWKPDVTGITSMTSSFRGALEAAAIAKECGSVTVIGGPQMDILPEESLSYPFVDYGFSGEAESSFPFFCSLVGSPARRLSAEEENSVKGLVYRRDGSVKCNPPALAPDLDALEFPARELLPNERYSSIIGKKKVTTMVSTRGCPYRCGFCFKGPQDARFRMRSAVSVVDEMEDAVKKLRVEEIMFYDDVLTLKRDHAAGICEEIIRRGLRVSWETPTRADLVDRELLRLMKRAGCIRLRYGVESGDPAILKKMGKNVTPEVIRKAFRMTAEEGIESFAYFIIGYAGETEKTMQSTIDLAKDLSPDLAMFTLATPLPGTPLFDEAVALGLVDRNYWSEYASGRRSDSIGPLAPHAEEYLRKAYRSFYFRPGYAIKQVLKIRDLATARKYLDAFIGVAFFRMRPDND